ncbi:hypothetical protein [Streptomyces sp. NPDC003327]
MGTAGETVLASRWDAAGDIARLIFAAVFDNLPEWIRYPLLAVAAALIVHLVLGWLRKRSGTPAEEDRAAHRSETDVR